jgi:hypothetical protein
MSLKDRDENAGLERRAKRAFDASVAELDAGTRARLAAARRAAIERASKPGYLPWLFTGRGLIPLGGLAAALVAALIVTQGPAVRERSTETAVLGDLEILVAEEEFDMLEDLEFYSWLDEQPEMESPNALDDTIG